MKKLQKQKRHIQNLRKFWDSIRIETVVYHHEDDGTPSKCRRTEQDPEVARKALYIEIIDTIVFQIDERFSSMHNLNFVALLQPQKYEEFRVNFPAIIFNILKENQSDTFDFISLKNELIVLYSYDEFSGQHPYQVLIHSRKNNLTQHYQKSINLDYLLSLSLAPQLP